MLFEWDLIKAEVNQRKHGVSFALAQRVFLDEQRIEVLQNKEKAGEDHWLTIGLIGAVEIVVVYTLRNEAVRLISARKAERHEREIYWHHTV